MTSDADFVLHDSGLGYVQPVTPEEQERRRVWQERFWRAYLLAGSRR